MSKYEQLVSRYEQGIGAVEDALRGIPEPLLDRVPAPGKWTIRQQAVHLADSELVSSARFRWIAAEPDSTLRAFDQDKWAGALQYGQQSPQEAFEVFRALRRATAAMLRNLPEAAWSRKAVHEERGPVTLEAMVELDAAHAEHHAQHIREIRQRLSAAA